MDLDKGTLQRVVHVEEERRGETAGSVKLRAGSTFSASSTVPVLHPRWTVSEAVAVIGDDLRLARCAVGPGSAAVRDASDRFEDHNRARRRSSRSLGTSPFGQVLLPASGLCGPGGTGGAFLDPIRRQYSELCRSPEFQLIVWL